MAKEERRTERKRTQKTKTYTLLYNRMAAKINSKPEITLTL